MSKKSLIDKFGVFVIFIVLSLLLGFVYAYTPGSPPEINIVKPTGDWESGSIIPFEIYEQGSVSIMCDVDGSNHGPFTVNTTINNFFGEPGLTLGLHNINCMVISPEGINFYSQSYTVIETSPTSAILEINPKSLRQNIEFVTAYIEITSGSSDANDINVSTVTLNGTIYPKAKPQDIVDHDEDGIIELMVKFDISSLTPLNLGNVTFTVSGELNDGTPFEAHDTVQVKKKGAGNIAVNNK
jgi:hypothetical protein